MIPKIIHQTWRTADLPERWKRWSRSWIARNPSLDYRFYDDTQCRDLIAAHFPQHLVLYDGFLHPVQRADFFRYVVVFVHGGIYADVDMECLGSFAPFLALDGALFGIEAQIGGLRQSELGYAAPFQIANFIFAAEPRHPFLAALIEEVAIRAAAATQARVEDIEDVTGPKLLTRLFYGRSWPNLRTVQQICWAPPRRYPNVFPLNKNMFARHHFEGSWKVGGARSLGRIWVERDRLCNPFPNSLFKEIG